MGRRSTVAKLDPRIREAVDAAIREGRSTIDELVALIAAHGGDASRSAVGRYAKDVQDSLRRYREAQEVAGHFMAEFRRDNDGDVARLLTEMIKTLAFTSLRDAEKADPKDLMFLSNAVKNLVSVDRLKLQIEATVKASVRDAVDKAVTAAAERRAIDAEALRHIRETVYGIVGPPPAEGAAA